MKIKIIPKNKRNGKYLYMYSPGYLYPSDKFSKELISWDKNIFGILKFDVKEISTDDIFNQINQSITNLASVPNTNHILHLGLINQRISVYINNMDQIAGYLTEKMLRREIQQI